MQEKVIFVNEYEYKTGNNCINIVIQTHSNQINGVILTEYPVLSLPLYI